MWRALFITYILGGLTFIPLVIAGLVFYALYTSEPVQFPSATSANGNNSVHEENDLNDKELKIKYAATLRRTFEPVVTSESTTYVSSIRSFLSTTPSASQRLKSKDKVWLVLKCTTLYIYEDEACTEVNDVVDLSTWDVSIFPSNGLLEGELFAKRNCILLSKLPESKANSTDIDSTNDINEEKEVTDPTPPYYIFISSLLSMESFYHTLLHASSPHLQSSIIPTVFNPSDFSSFISILDTTADPLPTRWFNALLARIFFSYYRTRSLESFILNRINKKLGKIKRPSWLTALHVPRVDVGHNPPMIAKPMLKNLTKEGEASVEFVLTYRGEFRITVEATATFSLPSTAMSKQRTYTVKLVLAAILKSLDGNLLFLIRPPPSNRIWYAFTSPPTMELAVEPVVSDRQIKWSLILGTIESKLREVILESIVLPNMDDIPFFNSDAEGLKHRGGLWGDAARSDISGESNLFAPSSSQVTAGAAPSAAPSSETPMHTTVDSDSSSVAAGSGASTLIAPPDTSTRRRTWFGSTPKGDKVDGSIGNGDEIGHSKSEAKEVNVRPITTGLDLSPGKDQDALVEGTKRTRSASVARSNAAESDMDSGAEKDVGNAIRTGGELPLEDKLGAGIPSSLDPATILLSEPESDHGSSRSRTWSVSSAASVSSNRSRSISPFNPRSDTSSPSVSPYLEPYHTPSEPDTDDNLDIDKKTKSNTKLNSSGTTSFLASLRAKNLNLKELNLKEGKEILSAQALGVVRKWGWNRDRGGASGGRAGGSIRGHTQGRESIGGRSVTSDEEVDVDDLNIGSKNGSSVNVSSRVSYSTLRDRVRDRAVSSPFVTNSSSDIAPSTSSLPIPVPGRRNEGASIYLNPPHDAGRDRRISLPATRADNDKSLQQTSLDISSPSLASTSLPSSSPSPRVRTLSSTSTSGQPTEAIALDPESTPSSPIPIQRSQPSIAQIPRMTIPGIHSSRKGEIMSISSSPLTPSLDQKETENEKSKDGDETPGGLKALSFNSTGKGRPPPLPPRRTDTTGSSSVSSSATATPITPVPMIFSGNEEARTSISDGLSTSPARQALKDVVARDTEKRNSGERVRQ